MSHRTAVGTTFAGLALALVFVACEPADDQETGSISRDDIQQTREDLDPSVAAALDSGNEAYRAEDYETALRHYSQVVELNDELPAGWFGMYMAHLALGDVEAANAAMERAQALAPGASLLHPDANETP